MLYVIAIFGLVLYGTCTAIAYKKYKEIKMLASVTQDALVNVLVPYLQQNAKLSGIATDLIENDRQRYYL